MRSALPAAPLLATLAVVLAVYAPRLSAPFAWDDLPTIAFNRGLDKPFTARDYLSSSYFHRSTEATWRPLATWSYRIPIRLAGKKPWALRLPNLVVHLAAAALLAWLALDAGLPAAAAAWAAAFFAVHPAHVETLLCVSFNEDVLAAAAVLAMLAAHRRGWTAAAALLLLAGMGAKETGALGLPLAALADRLLARPSNGGARPDGDRRRAYALYAAAVGLYAVVRFALLPGPAAPPDLAGALPWTERFYLGVWAFAEALRVLAFPAGLRIEYFAVPPNEARDWMLRLSVGAAAAAAFAFAWRRWRRERPALAFFLLWPLPFLVATSPLLPVDVLNLRLLAERWLYAPAAGAAALAAAALHRRPRAAAALLLALGLASGLRAADWSDERRLWAGLARHYPWSAKAHEGLGEARYRSGDAAAAVVSFERALRLREERADPLLARYVPLSRQLRWESPSLRRWLGLCYLRLGRTAEAEEQMEAAVALAPGDGFSYRVLSYLALQDRRFNAARAWAARGLAVTPEDDVLRRLEAASAARRADLRLTFY